MCRIAAFPPGFPRREALEILANFENRNLDGTGSAYIRDGKFVVDKWAKPFSSVARRYHFLRHMPYDGWTIAHLRAASHGNNSKKNTHPFVVGSWAFIHNGIWSEHKLVRLALSKQVTMDGETDSEVAAHLWSIIGPKKFAESVDYGGVFMGLHHNGDLWVAKTSGDLEIKALSDERVLLASEFDHSKYTDCVDAFQGWYHFGKDGKYIKHKENKSSWSDTYTSGVNSSTYCGGRKVTGKVTGYVGNDWRNDDRYFPNQHYSGD